LKEKRVEEKGLEKPVSQALSLELNLRFIILNGSNEKILKTVFSILELMFGDFF